MPRIGLVVLAAVLLVAATGARRPLRAQAADTTDVARARVLIEDGAYAAAADLLERYLERQPEDVGVRWLLARTLYWDGAHEDARRQLRLALREEPDYRPALELWRQMRTLWAPRIRTDLVRESDDQPLDRLGASLRTVLPLGARAAILAEGAARRLDAPRPGDVGVLEGRAGLRADPRDVPLELELLGGVHARPALDRTALVGSARLALTLPASLEIGLEARRWSYEHTAGAVDTAVMAGTFEAALSRSDPVGWGGSIGGRLDRFPGGGEVAHAWAWVLAPVWTDGRSAVRLGWAFQHQDADTTTFRPAAPADGGAGGGGTGPGGGAPGPPGGGPGSPGGPATAAGVYDPYYTPERVRAHVALAAVHAAVSPAVSLSADGGVGVWAREEAPALVADPAGGDGAGGDGLVLRFSERDYTPWRIRGRLAAELSRSLTLRLEAAYREEAFFRTASAAAALEWSLLGGLARP